MKAILDDGKSIYLQISEAVEDDILAGVIKEGMADGSIKTKYPDEIAEVMLLLLNTWCDPAIYETDVDGLERRLRFLQYFTGSIGVDVISDDFIAMNIELTKKIYEVNNGNRN